MLPAKMTDGGTLLQDIIVIEVGAVGEILFVRCEQI